MKILLFGNSGQLGSELSRSLCSIGDVIALSREKADFSAPESLREIIQAVNPDAIVNAAAYTSVEKAENEEELATLINGDSPGVLAEEAAKINALLIHYSTDYVFNGRKNSAYTEDDVPAPINAYGRSKLVGELAIQEAGCLYLIFRTSWVYSLRGNNFLNTILKLAGERNEISVVNDQVGSPTSVQLISMVTLKCLKSSIEKLNCGGFKSDLYHLTSSGNASWYEFALEIIKASRLATTVQGEIEIIPVLSEEYSTLAERPKNSRLNTDKLKQVFDIDLPNWLSQLKQIMNIESDNNSEKML